MADTLHRLAESMLHRRFEMHELIVAAGEVVRLRRGTH
eukprot:SAG31_NODE_1194_length_9448_cov_9.896887_5_plen_38_part_00